MTSRRFKWKIVFGEGGQQWSMGDPGAARVQLARRKAHHDRAAFSEEDALVLASLVSDLVYLVHDCPTTKLACQKLAALRAAVRSLPELPEAEA